MTLVMIPKRSVHYICLRMLRVSPKVIAAQQRGPMLQVLFREFVDNVSLRFQLLLLWTENTRDPHESMFDRRHRLIETQWTFSMNDMIYSSPHDKCFGPRILFLCDKNGASSFHSATELHYTNQRSFYSNKKRRGKKVK